MGVAPADVEPVGTAPVPLVPGAAPAAAPTDPPVAGDVCMGAAPDDAEPGGTAPVPLVAEAAPAAGAD